MCVEKYNLNDKIKIVWFIVSAIITLNAFSQQTGNVANPEESFVRLFYSGKSKHAACYRIPSLVTAPNGDIIAAVDERLPNCEDLKDNKDINIVIRRSTDNGNTWLDEEKLVDYPWGQSVSDPSMIVDHTTGEIFMFFNYMNLEQERNVYYLKVIKSRNNGKSWTTPEDITSQITKPEWQNDFKFITSERGFQTSKGKLLHTLVNLHRGVYLFESNNHGESWNLIDSPIEPADESKVIELSDGSWMVNSRVNRVSNRYVHLSNDEGRTWSSHPDTSLIDPGCNASIIVYSNRCNKTDTNVLVFANPSHKTKRKNLTLRVSLNDGKSWTHGKTIYSGSSAYSALTVLQNGEIGVLFEKDNNGEMVFSRIKLNWLLDNSAQQNLYNGK